MKLSDLDLDLRLPKPPMILISVLVIGAFVPMTIAAGIWYKRNAFSDKPRIHIFQDMDDQAKAKAQSASVVFADGRSMRPYAPGAVAWGRGVHAPDPAMLKDDDLTYRGYEVSPEDGQTVFVEDAQGAAVPKYLGGYPDTVTVDRAFIARGQQQYNIYCLTCHGADGKGVGPAKQRMDELAAIASTGTKPLIPADLHDLSKFDEAVYPNGRLYNTITHGQGTMGPIGQQIDIKDRWAIVAYVRALQLSENAPAE